ncbi:MAG: HAD family hydrolase [Bacillota bacterium]
MNRFRLAVFDLDGTLLEPGRPLQPEVIAAFRRLRAQGVHATLATGRCFLATREVAEILGIDIPLVAASGASVMSADRSCILEDRKIPLATARDILYRIKDLGKVAYAYLDDAILADREHPDSGRYSRGLGCEISVERSLPSALSEAPSMIVLRAEPDEVRTLRESFCSLGLQGVAVSSSMPHFLDFLPSGVSKARGVSLVAGHLGVVQYQIIAIGDGENDMEMLQAAGVGVLVANAPREIWASADLVTAASHWKGVLEALDRFVFSNGVPT